MSLNVTKAALDVTGFCKIYYNQQEKNEGPRLERHRSFLLPEVMRMLRRPQTPCRYPGCPKLVLYGRKYCDEHERQCRSERKSAVLRGYGKEWQKARKFFLKHHPWCVRCKEKGRLVPATVVDHIKPHRGDPDLFWDETNW